MVQTLEGAARRHLEDVVDEFTCMGWYPLERRRNPQCTRIFHGAMEDHCSRHVNPPQSFEVKDHF